MARSNTGSTSNRLSDANVPFSGNPVTIAGWIYPANLTNTFCLALVGAAAGATGHGLLLDGANTYGHGAARVVALPGTGNQTAGSASAVASANTWNHIALTASANNNRQAWLNGVTGTANTTSVTPASWNHTDVGAINIGSILYPLNGRCAEVSMWDVALSAAEMLSLAKGCPPLLIRPNNLVRYWPIYGAGTETCRISGNTLTVTGTMAKAEHPPTLLQPTLPILGHRALASGAIQGTSTISFAAATAALLGSGAMSATSTLTFAPTGTMVGSGELTGATSSLTFSPTGTMEGFFGISGTSSLDFSTSTPELLGSGSMSGASTLDFSTSATMVADGAMSGATTLVFDATGDLTGLLPGAMSATSSFSFSMSSPDLTGAGAMSGTTALTFTAAQAGTAEYPYGNMVAGALMNTSYSLTLGKDYYQ